MPPEVPTVSFCERITPQEYKEQSLITSQRFLKDLLNRIVDDESISAKDRRKQLKQVCLLENNKGYVHERTGTASRRLDL